jgi:hypothetical protein
MSTAQDDLDSATRRRAPGPLAAALAVALIAAAATVAVARSVHRDIPTGAAPVAPTTPPAAPPAPASPPQLHLVFAPLFASDDDTLGAPSAYGRLSLTGTDNTLAIARYALAVDAPPASPPTAPVWRLDRSPARDVGNLAQRFSMQGAATPFPDGTLEIPQLSYHPDTGRVFYTTGAVTPGPDLDAVPRDATDAAVLATRFMNQRGLFIDGMGAAAVTEAPAGQPYSYTVSWTRSLAGLPLVDGAAHLTIGPGSSVSDLTTCGLRVAGGSPYPLLPWHDAWTQVAAGRWFAERGGYTGGNGQSRMDLFTAGTVTLGYLVGDGPAQSRTGSDRDHLLPMWVFADAAGTQLFYPAVAPAELAYVHAP